MNRSTAENRNAKRCVITIDDDEPARKKKETELSPEDMQQKIVELEQKLAKSDENFAKACKMIGETENRVRFLENLIDTKPQVLVDAKKKEEEWKKKVFELTNKLEGQREKYRTRKNELKDKVNDLTNQLEEEREQAKEKDRANKEREDELKEKISKLAAGLSLGLHEGSKMVQSLQSLFTSTETKSAPEVVSIEDSEGESDDGSGEEEGNVQVEPVVAAPKGKLNDADVVFDQDRRREEEHKKTLFVKGFDRSFDEEKIRKLHPLIVNVRRRLQCSFAWVIFASEANADKAYSDLSKRKGLTVDYCGSKSNIHMALIEAKKIQRPTPLDPTLLCVRGITRTVTAEQLKTVFKTASDIKIPPVSKKIQGKTDMYALIHFESEKEAKRVFDSSKNLKIRGSQVTVMYSFAKVKVAEKKAAALNNNEAEKKKVPAPAKKQPPTAKKGKIPEPDSDDEVDDSRRREEDYDDDGHDSDYKYCDDVGDEEEDDYYDEDEDEEEDE